MAIKFESWRTEHCGVNVPVAGRIATERAAQPIARAPGSDVELDALAAVAAHRAMNSLAFVAGALAALEGGAGLVAEEEQQLLRRAITHTGFVDAVLHDLVLGLPLGSTPVAEEHPMRQAVRRFGLGCGRGD